MIQIYGRYKRPHMKLYFSPFACSFAAHSLALEAGIDFDLYQVDLRTKTLKNGSDFRTISPKGKVPALVLDDGTVLTESIAVLSYIADLKPELNLTPPTGSLERVQMLEWLSYIGSELHKGIFYPIFWLDDHHAQTARKSVTSQLQYLTDHLKDKDYLLGAQFTAADAYLGWWLILAPRAGIELDAFPILKDYHQRCTSRRGIAAAIAREESL